MTYTQKDLENDIKRVYQHVPYLEPILFLARLRVCDTPTAYCSPTELGFGAAYMAGLPPAERLGEIVHECGHALLCHVSDPMRDDHPEFHNLRNLAMDYVVDRFVLEACALSGGVIQLTKDASYHEKVQHYAVRNLSWKEIYDELKLDPQAAKSQGHGDNHTYGGLPPDQLEQAHKAAQELAQAAVQAMQAIKDRSQAGLTRPEGQLSTENGEAAPLDWRHQLRDYLQSFTVTGGQHWRSIELRSFLSFGTYSPKRTEEDHRLQRVRLLLDTSGSMIGDVADAVKDAARVLSQVGCGDAHLRFYGSGLLPDKVTLVEDSTVVKDLAMETSVPGGGGTSLISALGELAQEVDAIHFAGLTVVFTDGEDDLDVSACAIKPDVWVIYGSESRISRPSHGLAIYIEV